MNMNYNKGKKALQWHQVKTISVISNGNGREVLETSWANPWLACLFPTNPHPFFIFFCRNQEKLEWNHSWTTYITGIQVCSLGSDQDWCVKDWCVFVLHLLILDLIFCLREIVKVKGYIFSLRSSCQSHITLTARGAIRAHSHSCKALCQNTGK